MFVDTYVEGGRGDLAAIKAGYAENRAKQRAWELLQIPAVREAVEERKAEAIAAAGVTSTRVLQEIASIAFLDPADLVDEEGGLLPIRKLPKGVRAAVASIDNEELVAFEPDGTRRVTGRVRRLRLASKLDALEKLAKHLKLLTDRHEHTGLNGGPIDIQERSASEVGRRVAFLLDAALRDAGPSPPSTQQQAGDPL